jgi:hypothetical protein
VKIYALYVFELNRERPELIRSSDWTVPRVYGIHQVAPVQQSHNSVGARVLEIDRIEPDAAHAFETDALAVLEREFLLAHASPTVGALTVALVPSLRTKVAVAHSLTFDYGNPKEIET